jgi:hypothetical protein
MSTMNAEVMLAQSSAARTSWCNPVPRRRDGCCLVPHIPPQRPDLATYSQLEQISLGAAPSFNSPDITTNNDIPWKLRPSIELVVRNLSPNASAINALVNVSTSAFGIGMQQSPLSSQKINLGPSQQQTLWFPLTEALLAGDQSLGVFAVIEHPFDIQRINNTGAQVVKGVMSSAVGRNAALVFPAQNSSGAPRTMTFSVLANVLGATITPAAHAFAAWEQLNLTLHLTVPGSTHGSTASPIRNEITVIATASDGSLVGGVTWIYWVDD